MKKYALLGTLMFINIFAGKNDNSKKAFHHYTYHSPYHETVKDIHGISATMLRMKYLC